MHCFDGFRDQVADWTFDDWKDCLMNGTDKIRCEYCLDHNNRIKICEVNSRSSEEVRIDTTNCNTMLQTFLTVGQITLHQCWIIIELQVQYPKEDLQHKEEDKRASLEL